MGLDAMVLPQEGIRFYLFGGDFLRVCFRTGLVFDSGLIFSRSATASLKLRGLNEILRPICLSIFIVSLFAGRRQPELRATRYRNISNTQHG